MTSETVFFMAAAFFMVAAAYSMAGFGGGSSYLAILAMTGLSHQSIPPIALVCNLIVAGGGAVHFARAGHFRFQKVLPFLILSIPAAYWGGTLSISKEVFSFLLGACLLAAAGRMLIKDDRFNEPRPVSPAEAWLIGLPGGAVLGFVSGIVGIGGGIFLSPLLLLLKWVDAKQAAACASFFIVVNSLAGLGGHWHKAAFDPQLLLPLGAAVFMGGQIGSRLGAFHLRKRMLQRVLAVLVASVAIKMLIGLA